MSRIDNLLKIAATGDWHPDGKIYQKLTEEERDLLIKFIQDHEHLSKSDFALACNRWYLDDPNKPKRLSCMWALATSSNR